MKKLSIALVMAGVFSPIGVLFAADTTPAPAPAVTGNIGVISDYLFRGISQTQGKLAIQGGFDYAHASGLYAGTWMSNQSWVKEGGFKDSSSLEVDLYGGYKAELAGIGYDLGVIKYYYPGTAAGTTPDTVEAYVGLSYGPLSMKYSQAVSDYFIGWGGPTAKSKGSNYLELNATHDFGAGWGALAHIGHQVVKNTDGADYTDYKLGVTKDMGYGVVTLAYWASDADTGAYTFGAGNKTAAKDKLILSFAKSF